MNTILNKEIINIDIYDKNINGIRYFGISIQLESNVEFIVGIDINKMKNESVVIYFESNLMYITNNENINAKLNELRKIIGSIILDCKYTFIFDDKVSRIECVLYLDNYNYIKISICCNMYIDVNYILGLK